MPNEDWSDALDQALSKLSDLGLQPPGHLTLRRFLQLLAEAGATDSKTAAGFASLHEAATYSGIEVRAADAASLASTLVSDVTAWANNGTGLDSLESLLRPTTTGSVSKEETPSPPEEDLEAELEEIDPRWLPEPDPQTVPKPTFMDKWRRLGWRGLAAAAALILFWSAAMVALGAWQTDNIDWFLSEFNYHFLGGVRGTVTDDQLTLLRMQATRHPDSAGAWQAYVDTARRAGAWEEAASALRHLLVRNPDSAEALNDMAWLLCTSPAEHLRDPIEALALAERAFVIDPAPHITDTLAEAAFLNGDVQRAVALEQDALNRAPGEAGFYRRQLEKFQAALPP